MITLRRITLRKAQEAGLSIPSKGKRGIVRRRTNADANKHGVLSVEFSERNLPAFLSALKAATGKR